MGHHYGGLGPMVNAILWIEVVSFAIFVFLRLYTRISVLNSAGADDYLVAACFVLQIVYTILVTVATTCGLDQLFAELDNSWLYWRAVMFELFSQLAGLLTLGVGKCAVGVFLLRIVRSPVQKGVIWAFLSGTALITIFASVMVLYQCIPVRKIWDPTADGHCWLDFSKVGLTAGSWFVLVDFCFAILPWFVIWDLKMKRKEKLLVACGLSLGVIAGICGIVRTVALNELNDKEYIHDTVPMLIWLATESTVTIMCSSIPVLRPLYLRDRYGSRGDSTTGTNSSYTLPMYGNNSARNYGHGSTAGIVAKSDPSPHRTEITYNGHNPSDESILRDTRAGSAGGIRRTDSVEVSHSEGAPVKEDI